jgi:hypothetical protein
MVINYTSRLVIGDVIGKKSIYIYISVLSLSKKRKHTDVITNSSSLPQDPKIYFECCGLRYIIHNINIFQTSYCRDGTEPYVIDYFDKIEALTLDAVIWIHMNNDYKFLYCVGVISLGEFTNTQEIQLLNKLK